MSLSFNVQIRDEDRLPNGLTASLRASRDYLHYLLIHYIAKYLFLGLLGIVIMDYRTTSTLKKFTIIIIHPVLSHISNIVFFFSTTTS